SGIGNRVSTIRRRYVFRRRAEGYRRGEAESVSAGLEEGFRTCGHTRKYPADYKARSLKKAANWLREVRLFKENSWNANRRSGLVHRVWTGGEAGRDQQGGRRTTRCARAQSSRHDRAASEAHPIYLPPVHRT